MSIEERADLLIEARWLLPIAPANTALAQHAVAVTAGRIVAVGPAAQLRERFETGERVVRERHALLPGLVNAHTRAWHTLLRGLPVRGPRWRWLSEIMGPVEQRCLSADLVRDGTRLGVAEMLRAGITCFADLSLFPEEAARAAAAAHMRAAIGLPVAEVPTPWAESATAHLARAERLWDEYRSDSRIGLYFAPRREPHRLPAGGSAPRRTLAGRGARGQPHRPRHRQPGRRRRARRAGGGTRRGAALRPRGRGGVAPGDARRRHGAGSLGTDRIDRAWQGRRSDLHRSRRAQRRAGRGHPG